MTERPGAIAAIYDVPLPRPRTLAMMGDPAFVALTQTIRGHFYAQGTLDALSRDRRMRDVRPASQSPRSSCSSAPVALRLPFRFGAATVTRCAAGVRPRGRSRRRRHASRAAPPPS